MAYRSHASLPHWSGTVLPLLFFTHFPAIGAFQAADLGVGGKVSWRLPTFWRLLCATGSAHPPAMASPNGASGVGGSPEETELSITLTLRMLMHGKVTRRGLGLSTAPGVSHAWGGGRAGLSDAYHTLFSSPAPNISGNSIPKISSPS